MLQFRTFGYRLRPWARGGCPEEQALVGWWALRWAALPVGGGVILISRINRIRGIYDIWWFKAAKAPGVSTSPHGALLRMLKVEWRMLNSHSSSLSLAGGRRACPALKPDAADQVLLKNRAGFAAFSKGRAFPSCREQDRCAGDREAGSGGAIRMHRALEQCGHTAGWRGLTVGDVGITRRLSETYSADYLTCPQDSPGVFSLLRGLRPRARWRGHPDGAWAMRGKPRPQ